MALQGGGISAAARAEAPISAAEIIGVTTLYMAVCTAFTFARMCTRYFVHQQLWWDDWTMFFAWLGTLSLCSLQLIMIRHGAGVNVSDVPDESLDKFLKLFLVIQMVARIAIFFARLSILLLYIRIFFPIGTPRSTFWWIIQIVIYLNLLYTVSLILVTTLQCVPYHLPWGASCVNQWLVLIMASVINIISDMAVLVIPIASILKLQTTRRKKWAIWALFAFGALAPLVSVARLGYQVPVANGANKTVIYPIVLVLATAEQTVAMIVGSAPVASSAIVRLMWWKLPHSGQNKTLTQRIWPGREARSRNAKRGSRGAPDPYPITGATLTGSVEILYPNAAARQSDGDNVGSWEMVSPTASSDIKKAMSHGDSETTYNSNTNEV